MRFGRWREQEDEQRFFEVGVVADVSFPVIGRTWRGL
jgi:hypothetical protein